MIKRRLPRPRSSWLPLLHGDRQLHRRLGALLTACSLLSLAACQSSVVQGRHDSTPGVLLVCNGSTKPCPRTQHYRTIQSAVDAARPGEWILIWPGVYHENNSAHDAGIWITTPRLHVRGLDRNTVIVDGSHGSSAHPCPSSQGMQDFIPRDGIVVAKASGVTVENLTVCNYLAGPGAKHGTQIWWTGTGNTEDDDAPDPGASRHQDGDGGAPSALGIGIFSGSYLTTTSMYHPANVKSEHLAEFGIFAGDASGPGRIADSYASNMANAAFYIGACQRTCNTTVSHDVGENSAVGYLGTNSGGRLRVEYSTFTRNRTGMVLISLNSDDLPPPQDGRCPDSETASCAVIEHNQVMGNNNANAPAFGIHPAVGVGIEISGGEFDTVRANAITGNGSWGILVNDNYDALTNLPQSHCQGGTPNVLGRNLCLFSARGNRIFGNTLQGNGRFGNATNGDLAALGLVKAIPVIPRNCFYSNRAIGGPVRSSPAHIQSASVDGPPCGQSGTTTNPALLAQVGCANSGRCDVRFANYPRPTAINAVSVPRLATMPHPCAGVPRNSFCPDKRS